MIDLLKKLHPLHRTLVSDDTDLALDMIMSELPCEGSRIHEYEVGSKAWTWTVPPRYHVNKATLTDEDGNLYADFNENPLYLWSYSKSKKGRVSWQELNDHIYTSEVRPSAIPWYFRFYDNDWGFSVEHDKYLNMPQDKCYDIDIDVEFLNEPGLKVLTHFIDNKVDNDFLVCTNVCHPHQVNDSITGAVCAVELARRLHQSPIKNATLNINFLFCPETIGSISYLANNEEKIKNTEAAFFIEMLGHKDDADFMLQHSRFENDKINLVFEHVLRAQKKKFHVRPFARWNDEGNINGPGVDIPCAFLMRGTPSNDPRPILNTTFYSEYHTSDDNPDIISVEKLDESMDIIEEVVRIYCSDYMPRQKERGILFLSGLKMHISFYDDPNAGIFMDQIVYCLAGNMSVFEIAEYTSTSYWKVKEFVDTLYDKGAIEKLPCKIREV